MPPEQDPAKRVAKRVVKKTVVKRPVADKPAPAVRYGRPSRTPVLTPTKRQPAAKAAPPKKAVTPPKPPRELGKKAGRAGRSLVGGVTGTAGKVGSATGATLGKAWSYRLPHMNQTLASAISGALVGAVTVSLAIVFSMAFSELRGTSTGGGKWGSLTVVLVAFIAFAVGGFLLNTLHVSQPRVTSFLAVCLTLAAIMAFFLGLVDGPWAWLVMPFLGAGTYAVANLAITAADSSVNQPE